MDRWWTFNAFFASIIVGEDAAARPGPRISGIFPPAAIAVQFAGEYV
jgi:hypothetical protein